MPHRTAPTAPPGSDHNPGDEVTVITADTKLPGTHPITLVTTDGEPVQLLGCLVAANLPCTVDRGTSLPGCGAEDTMSIVRHPVRGLNLPGEQLVGQLTHCRMCGSGQPQLVTPTAEEVRNGWAPGTVS